MSFFKRARRETTWEEIVKAINISSAEKICDLSPSRELLCEQDEFGDTLLHLAYYHGRARELADIFMAFGADECRTNKAGLPPSRMPEVRTTVDLFIDTAANLSIHGSWINERRGRVQFSRLRKVDDPIYLHALVKAFYGRNFKRTLLLLAIRLGRDAALGMMAAALDFMNDEEVAVIYLNSGSPHLRRHAENWAYRHGYALTYGPGRQEAEWGSF
ncbi:hypothetical protein [Actinomadura sp. 6N118]|uniref:hypothetical protein n=1 Tax=Actinomadura sp. 6N118 TaxID=3375151 RepID=UPI0037A15D8B